MKKQLNILLGTALFTVAAISTVMAEEPSLYDSFYEAPVATSQILKQQEVMKRSVSLDTVRYDADSDGEEDEVQGRISRQNSQDNLKNFDTPETTEASSKKFSLVNVFEKAFNAASHAIKVVTSFFSRWF